MFEHRHEPLISKRQFYIRVGYFALAAAVLLAISWFIGILGYHYFENLSWIDSTLNSAMILGGMGPVNELYTNAGKIFASIYAIFSGVIFLISVGVILAPVIHRLFHRFHVQQDKQ